MDIILSKILLFYYMPELHIQIQAFASRLSKAALYFQDPIEKNRFFKPMDNIEPVNGKYTT